MNQNACQIKISSFDLSKAVTFSRFFSKITLSPTARLVIRCLIDFYNPKKGLVYPGQKTIADCTGASEKSITNAISELRQTGLIITAKKGTHLNYCFTRKFFELVEITDNNSKNCGFESVKITGTCIEQNKENKLNNNKNKILNFESNKKAFVPNEPKHISIEATKRMIQEQKQIQKGSPLDFNYEQAKDFLENLLPELRNSYFAKELRKKWKL